MALLSFPVFPLNGQIYPVSPPAGTNIYQWDSADQTWRLLGTASGVTAGIYGTPIAVPQITIDPTGRITTAVDLPIQLGDTTQVGLVQLVDDLISNDNTKALTAAQGYKLQNEVGDVTLLNPLYPDLVTAINAVGAPTGVTAGTYGNGSNVGQFTVDSQGRITSAVNVPLDLATTISPGVIRVGTNLAVTSTGLLSVPTATTTSEGAVQLVNDTTTNDAGKALTAAAGYDLQQQIDDINDRNNLTFAGTLDGATGTVTSVTPEGTAAGFTVGVLPPVPASGNDEYFVVITVAGTFTPPASPTYTANAGDWLISDGTQWVLYAIGPTPGTSPSLTFLDDMSGLFDGARVVFSLRIGGATISPGSNLMIFVGGVLQAPGVSYTVSGSTITFTEAPTSGASFVGVTVA